MKMADVVLLQTTIGYIDETVYEITIPNGLLHSAVYMDKEFDIKLIDARIDKDWKKHLLQELCKQPLFVALSVMTGLPILHALEASKFIKSNNPNVPIVWGGIHPTLRPEQTLENPNIDISIVGEGEITTHELAKRLSKEKSLKGVKGVYYKRNRRIKSNLHRPFCSFNNLPHLPYHLLDVKKYLTVRYEIPSIYLATSRGCLNACTFCYNPSFNKSCWRAKTPEKTLDMVKYAIEKTNVKNIFFYDDNFFVDMNRVKKIIKGFIDEGLDLMWEPQGTHIQSVLSWDKRFMRQLEKSGCDRITMGAESGSPKILKFLNKNITPEEVLKSAKKFIGYDIVPNYNFMAGAPTETLEDMNLSAKLMYQIGQVNPKSRISSTIFYVPYPGTWLYQYAIKYCGFKEPEKLEDWIDFNTDQFNLPCLSKSRQNIMLNYFLSSVTFDDKYKELNVPKSWVLLKQLYGPIARYRLKHQYWKFGLIERESYKLFQKLFYFKPRYYKQLIKIFFQSDIYKNKYVRGEGRFHNKSKIN